MKILITDDQAGAHTYIRVAAAKAFMSLGFECKVWNIKQKPAADVFDEYEPDIFISQTYNLTDYICSLILERPHLQVALRAPDYSNYATEVAKQYPILTAKAAEVERVVRLHEKCGQPIFLHCHYPQNYLNITHEGWIKQGLRVISVLNFADPYSYSHGQFREELASDICFIGFRHPYKALMLDPYIGQLSYPIGRYRIKCFGNGWGGHIACGYASEENCRDLLASATICPNIHEPHSRLGYDLVQRTFNNLLNKGFVISDFVQGLVDLLPDCLRFAKSPEEFRALVDYYLSNKDERLPFIERGYNEVKNKHTSFDRAELMLRELGFSPRIGVEQVKESLGLV